MRGRWTFAGAILSLLSGVESKGVDVCVDSAMMDVGGLSWCDWCDWMRGLLWCVGGVFGMTMTDDG